ncbi:uncharacterized protein LOC131312412 [Rhododendron vialii]|uniref:uncharacterized protein LOC131312412 n=1 Tax=Rhododendron vialii TaxID=182163 RepID=UPI00265D6359|nr:uncharacterized protein LOC131312412 [Rhododendron vialii]
MRRPSFHSGFFSSLKQVEKRLKLENPSQPSTPSPPPPPPPQETCNTQIESLSSPIYLNFDQPNNSSSSNINHLSSLQSSEPPREFLSCSLDFPQTHENPPPPDTVQDPQTINRTAANEIELLIQLLCLSDCEEEEEGNRFGLGSKSGGGVGGSCGHECGFYSKIVGVKGPKCGREVERLEGWIKHFKNDGGDGRREPLRLAYLLLAKAASLSEGSGGFGEIEFPTTVEEFLNHDPPKY